MPTQNFRDLTDKAIHNILYLDEEHPENYMIENAFLQFEVVQYALEVLTENVPPEKIIDALDKFDDFLENARDEFRKVQKDMYNAYDEIKVAQKKVDEAETIYYTYKNEVTQLETRIELCGFFEPFKKAKLKEELAELQKNEPPKPDQALYTVVKYKEQVYVQKQEYCAKLEKDFSKLDDLKTAMESKLQHTKSQVRTPKKHK